MLTSFQRAKIPNLFKVFDMDNDGNINQRDVIRIVNAVSTKRGWQNGKGEYTSLYNNFISIWKDLLSIADKNNDDQISLEEFLNFYGQILQNEFEYRKMLEGLGKTIFSTFDTDSDGNLSLSEYQDFYKVMGLESDFATAIYHHLDLDQNGIISIQELIKLLDQFFFSQDKNAPGNLLFGPIV